MSTIISNKTIVEDEGASVSAKDVINFVGAGVTVTNVAGKATVNIPGNPSSANYGLFAQTANSTPVTDTTEESPLIDVGVGSLFVPANSFQEGDSFRASLAGHLSCVGTAILRIRIKTVGGVLLADTGAMALSAATNKHWNLNIDFTVRKSGIAAEASIASGGLFAYTKNGGLNFEGVNFSIVNDTTFDTTIDNELIITAQWNAATTSDSIYSEIFTLSKTY